MGGAGPGVRLWNNQGAVAAPLPQRFALGTGIGLLGASGVIAGVNAVIGDLVLCACCSNDGGSGEPEGGVDLDGEAFTQRAQVLGVTLSSSIWSLVCAANHVAGTLTATTIGDSTDLSVVASKFTHLLNVYLTNKTHVDGVTMNPSTGLGVMQPAVPQIWYGNIGTQGLIGDGLGVWNMTPGQRIGPVAVVGGSVKEGYAIVPAAPGQPLAAIVGQTNRDSQSLVVVFK